MDLFSNNNMQQSPLAYRMRPRTLDEYIGQEHIIGKGRLLRRAIQADQLSSLIFYGPPGTGKTTLARVIANTTKSHFSTLNAVLSGVKELRDEISSAKERLDLYGERTILFVDEVHRWNKSQQDALLPWVENGTFILIGATTENPFFEVNAALVSRSRIFQLKSLTNEDLRNIAIQAIKDKDRGYGKYDVKFEEGALEHLIDVAKGDARSLLNALQLAVETSGDYFPPMDGAEILITKDSAEQSIQQRAVLYDKEGDYHFDVISAFIKSIRGSDPDASLYWLAKMVHAGEDPKFIFRRMLISATEDVGLADPMAVVVVEADAAAFDRIGLPEGRFHLTHAALYLATAKKSNSTMGFFDALKSVEEEKQDDQVPNHLRDASRDAKGFGHGEGYLYPHAYKDHWVSQQYLPSTLQGKVFYNPSDCGYEKTIKEDVLTKREAQLESTCDDIFVDNFTFSFDDKQRDRWLQRTVSEKNLIIQKTKNEIYTGLKFERNDRVAVLNAGHGLLLWDAVRNTPEGYVLANVRNQEQLDHITHYSRSLDELTRPNVIMEDSVKLLKECDCEFEKIIGRNQLNRPDVAKKIIKLVNERLVNDGIAIFSEAIPRKGSRISEFVEDEKLGDILEKCEEVIYAKNPNSITGWDEKDVEKLFDKEGFVCTIKTDIEKEQRIASPDDVARWLKSTYLPIASTLLLDKELTELKDVMTKEIADRPLAWKHYIITVRAMKNTSTKLGTDEWKKVESY